MRRLRPAPARVTVASAGSRAATIVGLLAIAAIVVAWLVSRNAGLYPSVLSDEYTYSVDSRLSPWRDARIPVYLFLSIYGVTASCGDDFLSCARLLNVGFFALGNVFVFACARRVVALPVAVLVAVVALASPFNAYTAFFMPEAMYYCGFWALAWATLGLRLEHGLRPWAGVGAGIGALALVKPHALFLAAAWSAYCALLHSPRRAARWVPLVGALVVGVLVVKYGATLLVSGDASPSLWGRFYGGMLEHMPSLASVARDASGIAAVHAVCTVALFAVPVVVVSTFLAEGRGPKEPSGHWKLAALSVVVIVTLVGASTAFTARVAGLGPYETTERLHLRYYSFAFPLLLIAGGMAVASMDASRRTARVAAGLVAACLAYFAFAGTGATHPTMPDAPEMYGFAKLPAMRRTFVALALATLAVHAWRPRYGALVFLCVLMPWFAWKAGTQVTDQLAARRVPTRFDRAGAAVHALLTPAQRARVAVVADDPADAYRLLFQIDAPQADLLALPPGGIVSAASLDASKDWIVVTGDAAIDRDGLVVHPLGDFALVHRRSIDPARP